MSKLRSLEKSEKRLKSRVESFDDPKTGELKRASGMRVRGYGKGIHKPGSRNPKKGKNWNRKSGK